MSNIKPIPAKKALQRLIQGNKRFVRNRRSGKAPAKDDLSWLNVKPRGPFAIILSCSDSRAPSEILFDQGLGDLFVIRVAGNIVAPSQVGSVEFAAATTQAQLVVVMGHSECGAVKATLDSIEGKESVPSENIQAIVGRIRPHIENSFRIRSARRRKTSFGGTPFGPMYWPRRTIFVMAASFSRSLSVRASSRSSARNIVSIRGSSIFSTILWTRSSAQDVRRSGSRVRLLPPRFRGFFRSTRRASREAELPAVQIRARLSINAMIVGMERT